MKKAFTFLFALLIALSSFAQDNYQVEMADTMRSSGMIYVVVAVICVIFLGLAAYLFTIDRKIRKLEDKA